MNKSVSTLIDRTVLPQRIVALVLMLGWCLAWSSGVSAQETTEPTQEAATTAPAQEVAKTAPAQETAAVEPTQEATTTEPAEKTAKAAPAPDAKDSIKEMKELRKRIEKARESIEDNKKEFEKTLKIYNAIFQEKKDLTGPYKKLIKALEELHKRKEKSHEASEAMQARSQEFFTNWEAKLASYTNEGLKQKSQERLDASRKKYDELGKATKQARGEYDAILASLNEQVTFLGSDLSPDAVAALQVEAAKVNQQSTAYIQKVDTFIAAIKEREAALAK